MWKLGFVFLLLEIGCFRGTGVSNHGKTERDIQAPDHSEENTTKNISLWYGPGVFPTPTAVPATDIKPYIDAWKNEAASRRYDALRYAECQSGDASATWTTKRDPVVCNANKRWSDITSPLSESLIQAKIQNAHTTNCIVDIDDGRYQVTTTLVLYNSGCQTSGLTIKAKNGLGKVRIDDAHTAAMTKQGLVTIDVMGDGTSGTNPSRGTSGYNSFYFPTNDPFLFLEGDELNVRRNAAPYPMNFMYFVKYIDANHFSLSRALSTNANPENYAVNISPTADQRWVRIRFHKLTKGSSSYYLQFPAGFPANTDYKVTSVDQISNEGVFTLNNHGFSTDDVVVVQYQSGFGLAPSPTPTVEPPLDLEDPNPANPPSGFNPDVSYKLPYPLGQSGIGVFFAGEVNASQKHMRIAVKKETGANPGRGWYVNFSIPAVKKYASSGSRMRFVAINSTTPNDMLVVNQSKVTIRDLVLYGRLTDRYNYNPLFENYSAIGGQGDDLLIENNVIRYFDYSVSTAYNGIYSILKKDNASAATRWDAATDKLKRSTSGLAENDAVRLGSNMLPDFMPAGLTRNATYYIRNMTSNDFQLSLTSGGPVIDFSSPPKPDWFGSAHQLTVYKISNPGKHIIRKNYFLNGGTYNVVMKPDDNHFKLSDTDASDKVPDYYINSEYFRGYCPAEGNGPNELSGNYWYANYGTTYLMCLRGLVVENNVFEENKLGMRIEGVNDTGLVQRNFFYKNGLWGALFYGFVGINVTDPAATSIEFKENVAIDNNACKQPYVPEQYAPYSYLVGPPNVRLSYQAEYVDYYQKNSAAYERYLAIEELCGTNPTVSPADRVDEYGYPGMPAGDVAFKSGIRSVNLHNNIFGSYDTDAASLPLDVKRNARVSLHNWMFQKLDKGTTMLIPGTSDKQPNSGVVAMKQWLHHNTKIKDNIFLWKDASETMILDHACNSDVAGNRYVSIANSTNTTLGSTYIKTKEHFSCDKADADLNNPGSDQTLLVCNNNGTCEHDRGESAKWCPSDCAGYIRGAAGNQWGWTQQYDTCQPGMNRYSNYTNDTGGKYLFFNAPYAGDHTGLFYCTPTVINASPPPATGSISLPVPLPEKKWSDY